MRRLYGNMLALAGVGLLVTACGGQIAEIGHIEQAATEPACKALITLTDAERDLVLQKGQARLLLGYPKEDINELQAVFPDWTSGHALVAAPNLRNMAVVAESGTGLVSTRFPGVMPHPAPPEMLPEQAVVSLTDAQRTQLVKYGKIKFAPSYDDTSIARLKKIYPGWTSGAITVYAEDLLNLVNIDAPDIVGIDAPDIVGIDAPDIVGIIGENDL